VASPVERSVPPAAPFFDLDKTIISRSSTLAFGPSFYRNGLFSRGDVARSTLAQMAFRFGSASHQRTERIRAAAQDRAAARLAGAHLRRVRDCPVRDAAVGGM